MSLEWELWAYFIDVSEEFKDLSALTRDLVCRNCNKISGLSTLSVAD